MRLQSFLKKTIHLFVVTKYLRIFVENNNKKTMKNVKNEQELIQLIEDDNYHFRGNHFETLNDLTENANEHFNSITQDYENPKEYYEEFGCEFGECKIEGTKNESYTDESSKNVLTVHFMEGYIDSGVMEEDYFHGFYISEN